MFILFLIAGCILSLVLGLTLIFCENTKSRVTSCFIAPGAACLLTTVGCCAVEYMAGGPTYAYSGYAITLYILPGFFIYSYLALPIGIVLGIVMRIIVGAFQPDEPFKAEKKS